jgi:AcrR family transcriptional regulator
MVERLFRLPYNFERLHQLHRYCHRCTSNGLTNMDSINRTDYGKPTLRQQKLQHTRDVIMTAMTEVVLAERSLQVSYEQVSEAAQVSVRTVYRHYPTKEDLVNEFIVHSQLRLFGKIDEPKLMSLEDFHSLLERTYRHFDAHVELLLILANGPLFGKDSIPHFASLLYPIQAAVVAQAPQKSKIVVQQTALSLLQLLSIYHWGHLRIVHGLSPADALSTAQYAAKALMIYPLQKEL